MRGIFIVAYLLVSNIILAQCSFFSLDVCGPYVPGGPSCGMISESCPGASDGVATASSFVWPSTGGVTYQWIGNGDTLYGQSVNSLSAGTYEVLAQSSLGCNSSVFIDVLLPTPPQISSTVSDVSCYGLSDGQASVAVTGDYAPYSVDFGLVNPNQLSAGMYFYSVSGVNGCQYEDSLEVFEPSEIIAQYSVEHIACQGSVGSVDVTVLSAGVFNFNWSNGANTEDLFGLAAGVYDVTISDTSNCSITLQNIEVLEPDSLELTIATIDASCVYSNDGELSVSISGGVPPYSFNYFEENPDSLFPGIYNVEVTDSIGCVITAQYTIDSPLPITASVTANSTSCFGESDGSAIVSASGGVQPYLFNWYGEDETALTAGTYSVTISDANGCLLDTSAIVSEPDSISVSFSVENVSCYNSTDGYIELDTVLGGTAPYSVAWTAGSDTLLMAGSYEVVLTDANACVLVDTLLVSQPDSMEVIQTITNVLCYGDSTGSASLQISGGSQPYTIDWFGINPMMLSAGVYPFVVSDDNACSILDSIQINQSSDLDFTATTNDVSCYGLSDGSVEVLVAGGQVPYVYDFMGLDTANLQVGSYTLMVVDANACVDSVSFQITEPDSLFVSALTTDVSCYSFSDGTASLNIQGGTGLYTENWNGFDPANLSVGQYAYEVFDENSCSFSGIVVIAEPDSLFSEETLVDASCFSYTDGSVQITPFGGVAPYQIDWAGEDSTALGAGNYIFTIVDSKGCLLDVSVVVAESDEILIESEITDVTCYNGSEGEIMLTVEGGLSPYNYMWSNAASASINTALSAGLYDVLVTDDMGCEQYASLEVLQPDSIQLMFDVQLESCTGIGDGALEAIASGGVMPYLIQWSNGVEDWSLNNVEAGLYTLTLIDANGCFAEDTVSMSGEEACFLLPTLFTPNSDGYNDTWNIQGMKKYPEAEVKVFARTGQLVFEQTGYSADWDGSYKGVPLPKGDYYYYLDLKDGSEVMQGVVTIKK